MPYRRVRPHTNEKVQRNGILSQYHHDHPEATFADIAQIFGVSRQRARQIVAAEQRHKASEQALKEAGHGMD